VELGRGWQRGHPLRIPFRHGGGGEVGCGFAAQDEVGVEVEVGVGSGCVLSNKRAHSTGKSIPFLDYQIDLGLSQDEVRDYVAVVRGFSERSERTMPRVFRKTKCRRRPCRIRRWVPGGYGKVPSWLS
jgi:hypothetical protein